MQIDLTQVVLALVGLLASIVTGYLIPWLRTKAGNEKWMQLVKTAEVAVEAAEKLGITGEIENKLRYATDITTDTLAAKKITYDEHVIRAAIEAAVYRK